MASTAARPCRVRARVLADKERRFAVRSHFVGLENFQSLSYYYYKYAISHCKMLWVAIPALRLVHVVLGHRSPIEP